MLLHHTCCFLHIVDFEIGMLDPCLSDTHCPVSVTLKSCMVEEALTCEPQSMLNGAVHNNFFMNWDTDSGQRYKNLMSTIDINFLNDHLNVVKNNPTEENMNDLCNELSATMVNVAKDIGFVSK